MSIVSLSGPTALRVVGEIPVGTEPRGCAATPNGTFVAVANHTAGTVSVIRTTDGSVVGTTPVGGNPKAVAITDDGDPSDTDETVYVSRFYAESIPGGPGEAFDDGKWGLVASFRISNPNAVLEIPLPPMDPAEVGFTADRSLFCTQLNPGAHSDVFCPDPDEIAPNSTAITADPQGVHPNQLHALSIRNSRVYVPNMGAGPEPPVAFNVNVQALVNEIDAAADPPVERADLAVNLNAQIKTETEPDPAVGSLARLFGNDIVAIDAGPTGQEILIVSRGGNYVLRARLDTDGRLDIGAPDGVVRYPTGNIPTGVVMASDASRAYVDNEVDHSITIVDLAADTATEVPSTAAPEPGSFEHRVLLGKLAFFTALGLPDEGLSRLPIRDVVPLDHRGKASDGAWSSCGSCHPNGLADGVTWSFPTGPRQTVPLDGFFSKHDPSDQRVSNWNGVRGSITDLDDNARNAQGGLGFAGDPPNPNIYDHGFRTGASESLDAMTLWVPTVRAPLMPEAADPTAAEAGAALFEQSCASCHGGPKWTKSRIVYLNDPTFDANPVGGPGVPIDPGIGNAGPQLQSYALAGQPVDMIEAVGTFDAADPNEIRGSGGQIATGALGGIGFNVPWLLGVGYHAPYLHGGAAPTLPDVFELHALGGGTIASELDPDEQDDLLTFLATIDGRTSPFASDTDNYRDALSP